VLNTPSLRTGFEHTSYDDAPGEAVAERCDGTERVECDLGQSVSASRNDSGADGGTASELPADDVSFSEFITWPDDDFPNADLQRYDYQYQYSADRQTLPVFASNSTGDIFQNPTGDSLPVSTGDTFPNSTGNIFPNSTEDIFPNPTGNSFPNSTILPQDTQRRSPEASQLPPGSLSPSEAFECLQCSRRPFRTREKLA
jgi:hypothetical protein